MKAWRFPSGRVYVGEPNRMVHWEPTAALVIGFVIGWLGGMIFYWWVGT